MILKIRAVFYLMIIFLILFIAGCGSSAQNLKVNLNCDDDCNDSNAIVVRMYQLRNTEKFNSTNFESLIRDPEEVLGDDVVPNSKFEKTFTPGEKIQMDNLELKEGALYLGVLGDFHSPSNDGWKTIIPLNEKLEQISIHIHENYLSFSVK